MSERMKQLTVLITALVIAVASSAMVINAVFGEDEPVVVNVLQVYQSVPAAASKLTKEEFEELKTEGVISFSSYSDYLTQSESSASFEVQTTTIHAEGANAILYEIADEYFQVYYGAYRISPIFPMAISNVETPDRADPTVSWCALFPTRYVSIEEVYTFDVTQVIRDQSMFKALGYDYSTRDRGSLQMSPTYGTSSDVCNSRMSGNEKDKLSTVSVSGYETWVAGASTSPGDRFYLPDVLLRMQAAMQFQVSNIMKNSYQPTSDLQLIAMLAMSHQSSGVWSNASHKASCGCWKSSELCYEWSKVVTSQEVINALIEYAVTHDTTYIDSKTADKLLKSVIRISYDSYATKSIVCTYPIKCIYSYIKLCQLYTR